MFLKRLQEDQQDMLELIQDREKARKKGLAEAALPVLKVPAPVVVWDVGNLPSPVVGAQAANPQPQLGSPEAQEAAAAPTQAASPSKLSCALSTAHAC